MNTEKNKLADVYGVSRQVPLTYVERPNVDGRFLNSLARDKHLVVYGGSKQGKTCLRKKCLVETDYIVVQCANNTTIAQLYSLILKEAGATVAESQSRTTRGDHKLDVEIGGEAKIPLLAGIETKASGEFSRGHEDSATRRHFEIDPADPNDVIRILRELRFSKFIVLEDFHYLSEETQKEVAIHLKAFHEKSELAFIIVGVWLESNRLVLYNGDLAGRLIPIDADQWDVEELRQIIRIGQPLLNIRFSPEVENELITACQGNVGILQEALYRLCEREDLFSTSRECRVIGSLPAVAQIIGELASEQAGRYQNFLSQFVQGFQKTELEMYKWIAYVIVTAQPEELKSGLKAGTVHGRIQDRHPERERLLFNNTLQALNNVRKLQHQRKVQPIILDYNANDNVLQVVDSGFILYVQATPRDQLVRVVNSDETT